MIEKNIALKTDFFGKEYVFEKLNPFTVKITSETQHTITSFSGELSVDMEKDFYERPYLIKFKDSLHLSARSQLKFFLKLPLITKLVLKNNRKSIEIDRHIEHKRKAWHGEVHRGTLCTYVEAEFAFEPFSIQDALVPLRIVNRSDVTREISKIVIEPENLLLVKGDNGLFTNKVYILVVSSNAFGVEYGTETTARVINPRTIIDLKISIAKTVLIRFDRFGIARELGL
ncbi:hypothetical protein ANME2D_01294 [Candidatus Methanoperedens nitroreducens]|uniref:DUF432 domain-containing protein n=1 Tax=Candidatus Methanoperedens nitratireducens TaxID=1392998 RepID=A0A062VAV3_9EURY|nr:DUF432 domain-containing protein [Candidatus Methanoperedens nitroreducens]KCZ72859.1 hypothetical protein ANME2D_01294 [Candidatus Methanoperedens nitroreducens]MDJ1423215.1 DUF432 domain-containing protein [Candidatus Methanoperedens sp.]